MAVPFENPIAAANVSLVFSRAPGSDPATEALRMALLGVAAVHQSFLLGRSGNGTGTSSNRSTDMMQFAQSLRMKSRLWLANACASVEGIQSDASLAASITVALMDIFTGGHRWMKNLDVAKNLVKTRGGPAAMLSRRTTSRPGVVTGASRARLLLEILTVYDIFGCLATGQEPSLLNSESTDWWLDESTARSHVEHVFGISAILVPLLAGIVSFVSRALNGKSQISDVSDDVTTPPAKGTTEYTMLQNLLDSWADPLGEVMARVHTGNTIYLNTAKIILLRDVGLVPPTDSVVQQCAETIITLCLQCAENKMSVDLNWPVIIAGSITYGAARYRVLDVFEIFRNQCCYEIDTSEQIVLEVWNRVDNDRSRADWRSVMKDLDLNVLIL